MNYSIILDVIAVAIIIISVSLMAKKGVIKSLYKILSLALTIIAVMFLSEPVENMITSVGLDNKIDDIVYSALISDEDVTEKEADDNLQGLPDFVTVAVEEATENAVVPAISAVVLKLVCALIIFLIAKLLIFLIFLLIDGMFKLPLLKSVNWLLGAATGVVSGFVIIYLICGIASLNVTNSAMIRQLVDGTYFVKYFYDNNLLMNLFLL